MVSTKSKYVLSLVLLVLLLMGFSATGWACTPWSTEKEYNPAVTLDPAKSDRYGLNLIFTVTNPTDCLKLTAILASSEEPQGTTLFSTTCPGPSTVPCVHQQIIPTGNPANDHWYSVQMKASGGIYKAPTYSSVSKILWVFFINWNGVYDQGEILSTTPIDSTDSLNGLTVCWTEARTGSRDDPKHTNTMQYTLHIKESGKSFSSAPGETCMTLGKGNYSLGNNTATVTVTNPNLANSVAPIPMPDQAIYVAPTMIFDAQAEQIDYKINESSSGGEVEVTAEVTTNKPDAEIVGEVDWEDGGVKKSRFMNCPLPSEGKPIDCGTTITGLKLHEKYTFTVTIKDTTDEKAPEPIELDTITIIELFKPPAAPKNIAVELKPDGHYRVTWTRVPEANSGYAIAPLPIDPNADNTKITPHSPIPQSDKPEVLITAKKGSAVANQYVIAAQRKVATDPEKIIPSEAIIFCLAPSPTCLLPTKKAQ